MILRAATLMALASPAWAECPVSGDLDTGIQLSHEDGTVEVYRAISPGIVELIGEYPDGYISRTLTGQGVYLLEFADLVDGEIDPSTRITYAMRDLPTDLPVPKDGVTFRAAMTVTNSDEMYAEKLAATWGEQTQMTYDGCSYTMIPGTLSYVNSDYSYEEGLHYLPELEFAYLASYFDQDMSAPDIYVVTSISKAETEN